MSAYRGTFADVNELDAFLIHVRLNRNTMTRSESWIFINDLVRYFLKNLDFESIESVWPQEGNGMFDHDGKSKSNLISQT